MQIDKESSLRRGCFLGTFLEAKSHKGCTFPGPVLGSVFHKNRNNIIKNDSNKYQKKRSPKNMKFDAKGVPKWNQNRCQNSSKINAITGNEKDQ